MPDSFIHRSFLIVDENPHMVAVLRVLLRALGADSVTACAAPERALAAVGLVRPDLILAAYSDRAFDALALTRRVRRGDAGLDRALPIVLVSSQIESRRVAAARDAGGWRRRAMPAPRGWCSSRSRAPIWSSGSRWR